MTQNTNMHDTDATGGQDCIYVSVWNANGNATCHDKNNCIWMTILLETASVGIRGNKTALIDNLATQK